MELEGEIIKATPTEYDDRTTPDGKTSSVHWVRFVFTPEQIAKFKEQRRPRNARRSAIPLMAISRSSRPPCAQNWRGISLKHH